MTHACGHVVQWENKLKLPCAACFPSPRLCVPIEGASTLAASYSEPPPLDEPPRLTLREFTKIKPTGVPVWALA